MENTGPPPLEVGESHGHRAFDIGAPTGHSGSRKQMCLKTADDVALLGVSVFRELPERDTISEGDQQLKSRGRPQVNHLQLALGILARTDDRPETSSTRTSDMAGYLKDPPNSEIEGPHFPRAPEPAALPLDQRV